ncbi:OmpA family protein [Bacteroides sp. UBA939]|uniref:OmpA family protein n=1 Tax=Bacteroides sp. UBA939 TaxID=1946092 RepID=UPI0025BAFE94|nr:OmpA family protein [Bacteroides sp. UBA939]
MKYRFLILSLLLAGASVATVDAQEKQEASDNIFIGAGVGAMTVFNDGLNSPTLNINLQVGKYLTPTWGVRGVLSGAWQSLEKQNHGYSNYCKKFGEINLDAMLNLNSLFGNKNVNRAVDVYLFGGPTINFSTAVGGTVTYNQTGDLTQTPGEPTAVEFTPAYAYSSQGVKARVGATAGLGFGYNVSNKLAITLEGRLGVTPSIFGNGSDCRKAEATGRLNLGLAYTLGGKGFVPREAKVDQNAINEEVNKYRGELAQAQADLANAKNALANAKGVTKEVVKEIEVAGPRAIFFRIGSAQIDDYGTVNIQLAAKTLKANPGKKYKIAGYADKATGSSSWNQKLSEKRAQAVYDALLKEGVSKDQLELVGFGGTANMFGKNYLNRVVILE